MLFRAVRVKEVAAYIHYFFAVPDHRKSRLRFDAGDDFRLQILFRREREEFVRVGGIYDDSHTLLRFADRKFGSVESVVLAGNGVKVDIESVGEFADSHAYAARAEVVATLDKTARFG